MFKGTLPQTEGAVSNQLNTLNVKTQYQWYCLKAWKVLKLVVVAN